MRSFSLGRSLLLAALAPAFAVAAQSPAPLRAEFVDPAKPEFAAIRQAGEAADQWRGLFRVTIARAPALSARP